MDLPLATEHRAKIAAFQRKHRTAVLTLVFTDIVGSTKLKQDLGDLKAVALIQDHHALFRELLGRFPEAEEVDNAGDSFFVIFARPSDAARFALSWQSRLRRLNAERGHSCAHGVKTGVAVPISEPVREKDAAADKAVRTPILDRIGIHLGEVVVEERPNSAKPKDLYGRRGEPPPPVCPRAKGQQTPPRGGGFQNPPPPPKGK